MQFENIKRLRNKKKKEKETRNNHRLNILK
jgi:hypothetical protein